MMFEKIGSYLLHNANQNNERSISNSLRKKRADFFFEFCKDLDKPVSILDLGGSDYHWRNSGFINNKNFYITIVNTEVQKIKDLRNVCFIKMNVNRLDFFDNGEYDVVYSNSLIEHLNTFEKQMDLAEEIKRIGKHYFIQTPDYYFPVEPHFLFPFFQHLSEKTKVKLLMKYKLGWFEKQNNEADAAEIAASIRLLKKNELEILFPGAQIYREKYFLLNKSFIAYK